MHKRHFEPGHPIVFLPDLGLGEAPEPVDGMSFQATPTCISLNCTSYIDGGTRFSIGPATEFDLGSVPNFEGALSISFGKVVLSTAESETILEHDWPDTKVRVRIWTNHPQWPDKVDIGLG